MGIAPKLFGAVRDEVLQHGIGISRGDFLKYNEGMEETQEKLGVKLKERGLPFDEGLFTMISLETAQELVEETQNLQKIDQTCFLPGKILWFDYTTAGDRKR